MRKRGMFLALTLAFAVVAGCSSSDDITMDTPCRDYLHYSDDDRSQAVHRLAKENHVTGLLNVDGGCMNFPRYTVGQALRIGH